MPASPPPPCNPHIPAGNTTPRLSAGPHISPPHTDRSICPSSLFPESSQKNTAGSTPGTPVIHNCNIQNPSPQIHIGIHFLYRQKFSVFRAEGTKRPLFGNERQKCSTKISKSSLSFSPFVRYRAVQTQTAV